MRARLTALLAKLKLIKPLYIGVGIAVVGLVVLIVVALFTTLKQKQQATQNQIEQHKSIKITRSVSINGKEIKAEVANSPQEKSKGLMYRTSLADGTGMLFPFGTAGQYPFWMKNMKISIDIIWIDADLNVIDMDQNVPPCQQDNCELYTPDAAAKYVLEVPAGWAQQNGVQRNNKVQFGESKQEFVD